MPTILLVQGWRFFFYANERNEPIHVHARKAGMECKYWLKSAAYDVVEAFACAWGRAIAGRFAGSFSSISARSNWNGKHFSGGRIHEQSPSR